jgi:KDO2-lipid IV(A) lauroyltransferase
MAQQAYSPFVQRLLRRAPSLRRAVWTFEAAVLGAVFVLLGWLSPDRASALGRAVGRRIGPRLRKHRHVRENLRTALPDRSPAEIDALAREVWGNFGAVLGEFPHLDRLWRERRIEPIVKGELTPLSHPPIPVVFVTAHLANWELTALTADRLGVPLAVVYAEDSNPSVDRLIRRRRSELGCDLISRDGGIRALLRTLSAGRSVGLVVDTRQDGGEAIPFFGVDAPTSTVPARLALRHEVDLVPVRVERTGPGARFRVTFGEALRPTDFAGDPREQARAMTRALHARFEGWIRERPEEWLCTKRRWPKARASAPDTLAPRRDA